MAKKGRKSVPVQPKKGPDNTIRVPRVKVRGVTRPGQRFHNRSGDVRRGSSRKPKHKGKQSW